MSTYPVVDTSSVTNLHPPMRPWLHGYVPEVTVAFQMRKYGLLGGAILIVCFIVAISFYLHVRGPASTSSPEFQRKLLLLSPYDLPSDAVEPLKAAALGGNCKATKILMRNSFVVRQDFYGGLQWARVGAKNCPDAEPKMELGMILVHYKSDPKAVAEVADLIVQIRKTDPAQAAELQYELEH